MIPVADDEITGTLPTGMKNVASRKIIVSQCSDGQ
jgi:hypothetical protein